MIEIKHRFTGKIIFKHETAKTIKDAVIEAVKKGAYLRGADLGGAYLRGAYLRGADLGGAYLRGAEQYSESHDIFTELVKRKEVKIFTRIEWECIAIITIHRICWDSIKKRFGNTAMKVFKKLSKSGFDEYEKRYKEILGK